jgi:hypothetical protein
VRRGVFDYTPQEVERGGMEAVLRCPVGWSGDHRVVCRLSLLPLPRPLPFDPPLIPPLLLLLPSKPSLSSRTGAWSRFFVRVWGQGVALMVQLEGAELIAFTETWKKYIEEPWRWLKVDG